MASVTMATSEWIQFFKDAGIPPGPAVSYAVTFVDNRIQKHMLLDLTKEIVNELGITVVGDVIAILKHAQHVHRQELCKAATQLLHTSSPAPPADSRRLPGSSAASRMIQNSLNPPRSSGISVTVASDPEEIPTAAKRRRVTAEMEGKYVIRMPKGTTERTRKILEQQAARGGKRPSVFQRLGAEAGADSTVGGQSQPSGVFSRLGESPSGSGSTESTDSDVGSALPYAGVLKKLPRKDNPSPGIPVKARATSSDPTPLPRRSQIRASRNPAPSSSSSAAAPSEPQDGAVTSSRDRQDVGLRDAVFRDPGLRVTIQRNRVSSSSGDGGARMDDAGAISVFKRLGRKPD